MNEFFSREPHCDFITSSGLDKYGDVKETSGLNIDPSFGSADNAGEAKLLTLKARDIPTQ